MTHTTNQSINMIALIGKVVEIEIADDGNWSYMFIPEKLIQGKTRSDDRWIGKLTGGIAMEFKRSEIKKLIQ